MKKMIRIILILIFGIFEISIFILLFINFIFNDNVYIKPISNLSLLDLIKILTLSAIIIALMISTVNIVIKNWNIDSNSDKF